MKRTIPVSYDFFLGMIQSHASQDHSGFQKKAEAIITELSLANRTGEAKMLRHTLSLSPIGGNPATATMTPQIKPVLGSLRNGEPLIAYPSRKIATEDVVLTPTTRSRIEKILAEYRSRTRLAEAGLAPSSRILFWGPPGCGKTLTAQWLAGELGIPFGLVRLSAVITSYVGETASNLQKIFQQANETPLVILLDEADAIAKNREDRNDVGELKRVVNSLLQAMDELKPGRSIVIFASNHQHLFDPAIWRRFDEVVEFPLPAQAQRLQLLTRLTSGLKINGSLNSVAQKTTSASFADIARICSEVTKASIIQNPIQRDIPASDLVAAWKDWQERKNAASRLKKTTTHSH
jgi:SpoVK/Ycf46/Vps4 family AAA+-type ATPase